MCAWHKARLERVVLRGLLHHLPQRLQRCPEVLARVNRTVDAQDALWAAYLLHGEEEADVGVRRSDGTDHERKAVDVNHGSILVERGDVLILTKLKLRCL